MAYVTISVIAATFRRAQLHFGNYLESALKAPVPLRPLRTYARVNLHARDRQHVHTRALFGRHYAKVQKVTSDPYVGGLKSFRGMPFPPFEPEEIITALMVGENWSSENAETCSSSALQSRNSRKASIHS